MLALAILMGVIYWAINSDDKKTPKKSSLTKPGTSKVNVLRGSSSGYDPERQIHWTREDTMEICEL